MRFTFPLGFTTKSALCDVTGVSGLKPTVKVMYNYRTVTCLNVQKKITALQLQVARIGNMINPSFSGVMQGFTIDILEGSSTVVLETIYFPGNVKIDPG